ncbi:hypothetical protein PPTG_24771 [Phytophthora nicotianae INRA-310]|uniref:AWS domain-containing protein n=1 Tax=Phytophthora nicotianae (strain INRA-310) TaxID=761204 RepID=W2PD76_PHYN3|nr:hypothetical protein PPTG_24771 [Phytophthora nicotianae INRA-310]ETM97969.1 hypothetical protein PPTG_24771 [Phytophthora nicotianae INRA-310]
MSMGDDWLARPSSDAPVCMCEFDEGEVRGCRERCLNRSMRFECAVESCPCGDRCSNRQLQQGTTLKTAGIDCGLKGVEIIALEYIAEGRLVGEYVGELLGRREAQLRSKVEKWSVRGQERCGLFANRCVRAGDEITFDYNLVSAETEVWRCAYMQLLLA